MKKVNPIVLNGNWIEGFAMDYHSVYSNYLGVDDWGREQFDTTRTEIGQLLYELKYQSALSNVTEIVNLISPFLEGWKIANKIDYIIPVPPSKQRKLQPVYELCKGIGQQIKRRVLQDVIIKNSTTQSKNLGTSQKDEITGSIIKNKRFKKKVNLLIIDDLYQSGKTLNETTNILKNDLNVGNIYILTMTKTRG